jgi:ergothioneine biosynthesis protein EgtB
MALDREALLTWYRRNRERSRTIFGLLSDDAFFAQPISLRHPVVFYVGHLPGFSFNTLVKRGLGGASIDPRLETLFARGIDPSPDHGSHSESAPSGWPSRDEVDRFVQEADRRVIEALEHADLEQSGHPLLDHAEAAFAILEHEAMHQETLLYMWQRLPLNLKRRPAGYEPVTNGRIPTPEWIEIPPGCATLGVDRGRVPFAWDNERPAASAEVQAFAVERHNVTNVQFLEFVESGGYRDERWWRREDWEWIQRDRIEHPLFWDRVDGEWRWRAMFDVLPLPLYWPVYCSQAEASAYARWRGARLLTEAEFQRAAFGSPHGERRHPWGSDDPAPSRGVFDFTSWDPQPVGTHRRGASAWGVEDLVGNGWEWTSTTFAPFPGFRPIPSYPEYSADFFDGEHFVMKGASSATARELIRPSFRNWFRPHYPYVYASFRCVKNLE